MASDHQRNRADRASGKPAPPLLSLPSWLRVGEDHLTVEIGARPGSGKRGWLRTHPMGPVVALTSVPEKGRANRELIEFIAELLAVPASTVSIVRGHGGRQKVIRIKTAAPQVVATKLVDMVGRRG